MKKIFNRPEIKLVTITHDVIATSGDAMYNKVSTASQLVGARDYYEDEEEIW